jgi:nucleotide-binding universal stress UspA family protein
MYQRILVPVDGSDTSRRGLKEAVSLSKALGSTIRIVHIVDDSPLALNPEAGVAAAPLVEDFAEGGKEIIANARALAAQLGADVETALHENFAGRVADRIVDEAKEWGAELIVMGTHGRGGLRHAVLGSQAEAVVRAASVPVLLVRESGGGKGRGAAARASS